MCVKITVLNCSPESVNRAGVTGTSIELDVPETVSVKLSKSLLELTDANAIVVDGVLPFSLTATRKIDAAFLDYLTATTIDRNDSYPCRVEVGGVVLPVERIVILGKRGRTWDLQVERSKEHWSKLASQFKLNELDYGTFTLTKDNLIANWSQPAYEGNYHDPNTGQPPLYFPLVDYGGWADRTERPQNEINTRVKAVALEDFRPFVSLSYTLKAGFCAIGYTIDGVIFDSDWMKRLWIYILRSDYYIAGEVGRQMRIRGRLNDRFRVAAFQYAANYGYLAFTELIEGTDPWTVKTNAVSYPMRYYAGITNNANVSLQYKFVVHGQFSNELNQPYTAIFNVVDGVDDKGGTGDIPFATGEIITGSEYTVDFLANETKEVYYEAIVTLKPNQTAFVDINAGVNMNEEFWAEKGMWFSIEPDNKALHKNDTVVVQKAISDQYNLLELFKGFIHLIRGRFTTDELTKTITVFPANRANVYGTIVPGFFLSEEPTIDLDGKVIAGSINTKPVRPTIKRYTELGFKESTDAYITSLEALQPPNGRKLLNGVQFADGTTQLRNPFFEPTQEGKAYIATGSGGRMPTPYLPRLWDNTNEERSFVIAPRILYAYGAIRQVNPTPINPAIDGLTAIFLDAVPNNSNTGLQTTFGYATQLPTWRISPTPTRYAGVVYGGGGFDNMPDLFTMFYLGISQENRYGTLADLLLYLRMTEYMDIDFRRMYSFSYMGKLVKAAMQDIRDFAPCDNTPTPVTLFVPPVETTCCDIPCGCQFSTCEYYQDFGVYMQQSTLDDLKVASFVVDGIELVDTPVGFGVLKIVNNGGLRYVMNLIETLNSIAAPYFTFLPSTRKDTVKGMRFFKIKKPACLSFEIVIEFDGEPVYRYTESVQQTTEFNTGFGAFGYTATPYGVPDNCEITTEY